VRVRAGRVPRPVGGRRHRTRAGPGVLHEVRRSAREARCRRWAALDRAGKRRPAQPQRRGGLEPCARRARDSAEHPRGLGACAPVGAAAAAAGFARAMRAGLQHGNRDRGRRGGARRCAGAGVAGMPVRRSRRRKRADDHEQQADDVRKAHAAPAIPQGGAHGGDATILPAFADRLPTRSSTLELLDRLVGRPQAHRHLPREVREQLDGDVRGLPGERREIPLAQ
jgi:hypothetical protein